MTRDMDSEIREWLEAEAAGRADEADLRFRSIGRRLERRRTPPGFADAVIARLGAAHAAQDAYARRWVRVAVAASVVLVGGAAAWCPGTSGSMACSAPFSWWPGGSAGLRSAGGPGWPAGSRSGAGWLTPQPSSAGSWRDRSRSGCWR